VKKDQFVFLQHILDSIDDIQNDSNYLGNVWKVVTDDIPVLRKKIEEILKRKMQSEKSAEQAK